MADNSNQKTSDKYVRTFRITKDMNDRLVSLCNHLGTNPNSYITNEIGKCISRDEIAFNTQKRSEDMFLMMQALMAGVEADMKGEKQGKE